MLAWVAWADRAAKRDMAQGKEPRFNWAWLIFSLYLLAQGIWAVLNAWIYEKYAERGFWNDFIWKSLSAILLGVAIPNFLNQVRWLIYARLINKE